MAAPRAQRADARRNIAAILDAATDCLARDPDMSIAGIAAAAGVGRITLYGHFKTRAALVNAVPWPGPCSSATRSWTPPTPPDNPQARWAGWSASSWATRPPVPQHPASRAA